MKSTISLNMKAEHLKRLAALVVVILFCYHAIIALAEQRIATSGVGVGDSPSAIYMSESAEFGGGGGGVTEASLRPQVSRPNSIQEQQQALYDQQQTLDDTRRPRYPALRYLIRGELDLNFFSRRLARCWRRASNELSSRHSYRVDKRAPSRH